MAVTNDRKFTKEQLSLRLSKAVGRTLGEVDERGVFGKMKGHEKVTGIAGDVVEQSVLGYEKDSKQECDIEIDGMLWEVKTTGVRVPKGDYDKANGKTGKAYNIYLHAKEGVSITHVTFEPTIELDFQNSHFWEKSEHLLLVLYEYKSYDVVPAAGYASFPIVDYWLNEFSETEVCQLRNDWNLVRDYLQMVYDAYPDAEERAEKLVGFTHILRPDLLLMELVPGFKRRETGSYQKPRYRLKQTFVDYLVRGHFNNERGNNEIQLPEAFTSFDELRVRCSAIAKKYAGKTLSELQKALGIESGLETKDMAAKCIVRMFGTDCERLNDIADFTKAGIIAKTITITPDGGRTEDMKLQHIDFDEWASREIDFEESEVYGYFNGHTFLCPIFCEYDDKEDSSITFLGFKRLAFDEEFIQHEVRRTWNDSRGLIHGNLLKWEYRYDKNGEKRMNGQGCYMGAPNFPKSSEYAVFFRGGARVSNEKTRTECVNGIRMLPQFFWIKGTYITQKLNEIPFL